MSYRRIEDQRACQRKWAAAHPEYGRAGNRRWRERDPRNQLLASARKRAKKLGLGFNLVKEDLVIPEICPALGIPLVRGTTGKWLPTSPTTDRVDPAKGYVRGNVVIISHRANRIKNDASADELRKIADYIDKYLRLN